VGIGTTTPTRGPLHVHENSTGDCAIHLTNTETGATSGDGFTIFAGGDAGPDAGFVNRENNGAIEIYTNNGSAVGERLRITSNGGLALNNAQLVERVEITAGKLSANQDIDLADGMVHYFTTQEDSTATPNIRIDGSTTLNSAMDSGDVITVTLITTAAAAGYSANLTIDGVAVTEEWVGGAAPSAGGADGLDIYTYTIICIHNTNTGDSGFKVIANLTNATN
jgi:hypothetical protein